MANEKKTFYQLTVPKMGYPGAEAARYLEVTTSSVNRLAVFEEAADLKKYLKILQSLRRATLKLLK
jgi:hypothetical protein